LIFILQIGAQAALPARSAGPQYPPPPPEQQTPDVELNLQTFDVLDFDVFSHQNWDHAAARRRVLDVQLGRISRAARVARQVTAING